MYTPHTTHIDVMMVTLLRHSPRLLELRLLRGELLTSFRVSWNWGEPGSSHGDLW